MLFFEQLSSDLRKINISNILNDIFTEKNIQEWVIDAIQLRLEITGIDGKGQKIKTDLAKKQGLGLYYAHSTINEHKPPGRFKGKKQKGQNYKNVTFKDSETFYNSMRIILNNAGFVIDANFEKKKGNIYKNFTQSYSSKKEFSSDIMSLTPREMTLIMETKVIPLIKIKINEII